MKLSILFLVLSTCLIFAESSYAQQTKLSLTSGNRTLNDVFSEIERVSEYIFFYTDNSVDLSKKVEVSSKKETVDKILNEVLGSSKIGYKIVDRQIILFDNKNEKDGKEIQQDPGITVSGKVLDSQGKPLPFVSVLIKDKTLGTSSDENGHFTIKVSKGDILQFSFLGFKTQEQTVGSRTQIDVKMAEDENMLAEAVVIGYQTQDRRLVTSAITSVKAKDLEMIPAASIDVMLQGIAPGVNIQNYSGIPGGKPTLMIRGNTNLMSPSEFNSMNAYSSPLYIIDGMPVSDDELQAVSSSGQSNFLASLNPSDVESVDILKDAAATAIYGARGANGVILIKTKQGKMGKPKVIFNGSVSYMDRPQLVETLMGAEERQWKINSLYLYGDYDKYKNNIPQILTDSLNPAFNNANDWQNLFYRSGLAQDYRLSVSGGSEAYNYRLSAGYYDEKGILNNTGFKRFTFNSNLLFRLTKDIELRSITLGSRTSQLLGKANEYGSTSMRGGFGMNPISMPASYYYLSETDYQTLMNPDEYQRNDQVSHNISSSLDLRIDFLKNFTYRIYGLYMYNNDKYDFASPSFINESGNATAYSTYAQNGKGVFYQNLTWLKTFSEKHTVGFFAGQEFEHRRTESLGVGGSKVPNDNIQTVNGIPASELFRYGSNLMTYSRLSYMARFNYDYKQKYILDIFGRADASSRFGINNRWGHFPSASVAWRITEENFMKNIKWAKELKLRLSYGKVGDEGTIGDADRYNTYTVGNGDYSGSKDSKTYGMISPTYPDFGSITKNNLKWQQKTSWNIGIDYDLFNYRLSGTVNVYHDVSERQMLDIWAPESSGYNTMKSNAAGILNQGVEFNITAHLLAPSSKLQWKSSFNITYNDNRVVSLPDGNRDLIIDYWNGYWYETAYYIVGKPMNMFYGLVVDGVINNEEDFIVNPYTGAKGQTKWGNQGYGSVKWRDVNGDYKISDAGTENDQTFYGNPNPKFTGGFINNFQWKNWSLNVICNFTFGRDIINQTLQRRMYNSFFLGSTENLATRSIPNYDRLNYWRQEGDQATWGSMSVWRKPPYSFMPKQSNFMEDGWYFRINNVTLSYNLINKEFLNKMGISRVNIWGGATNVALFQSFTGPDAERVDAQGRDMGDGYPVPRRYTFGLNVEF